MEQHFILLTVSYFLYFKFDARVRLVHELLGLYADAVPVVADGLALLEAVEDDFQAVVQVRTLVLIEHVYPQGEKPLDVRSTVFVALQVEGLLVLLQRLLLGQRAMAVKRHDLVTVAFARAFAPYSLHFSFFHVQVVLKVSS